MGRKLGRRRAETLVVKLMAGCNQAGPMMPKAFLRRQTKAASQRKAASVSHSLINRGR
jgi:hypothetical protein